MDIDSCLMYIFFLLASAYFASCETAYTAVSRVRLRTMADKGNKRAKKALWVCDHFDKTLTTVLIGNNIFQRGYFDHVIRDQEDYEKHVKYIYENSIRWYYKHLNMTD